MTHPVTGESGVWFPDKAVQEILAELQYRFALEDTYNDLSDAYTDLNTWTTETLLPAYNRAAKSAALFRRQRNWTIGLGIGGTVLALFTGLLL